MAGETPLGAAAGTSYTPGRHARHGQPLRARLVRLDPGPGGPAARLAGAASPERPGGGGPGRIATACCRVLPGADQPPPAEAGIPPGGGGAAALDGRSGQLPSVG